MRCGESERQGEEEIEVGRMREKRKSGASLATTVRRKMMEKRGEDKPKAWAEYNKRNLGEGYQGDGKWGGA